MENFNTMMEDLWDAVDSRFSLRFNRNSRLGHIQSARFYITTLKSEAANFLTSIDLSLVTSSQA